MNVYRICLDCSKLVLSEWINNKSTAYNITPETAEKYLKKAIYVAGKSTEKHGAIAALKEI